MNDYNLYEHQKAAINRLKNGSILNASVGTGKSRTALAYYAIKECKNMKEPKDIYIITTARKRDTYEWELEMAPFHFDNVNKTVDSWNNIRKYCNVCGAFFIFDEQRVVGSGAWVKAFLQITKKNSWILLTATPGDTWMDFVPVFIANGFYKNRSDFIRQHVVYSRFAKYPKIDRYLNVGKLIKLKESLLVNMNYIKPTEQHHEYVNVKYDKDITRTLLKDRWNVYENEPIRDAGQLCYLLRRAANESQDRIEVVKKLIVNNPRVIVFYNFDYELDILRKLCKDLKTKKAEWNGHLHQPIPKQGNWVYLVQYTAGAEGWNCTQTNTMIFYSQNYSYKTMVQAAGRIDRMNTPYSDLYYYHIKSLSPIDIAISRALKKKQNFNENVFIKNF